MELTIGGSIAQYARLALDEGDTLWASRGALISYSAGIRWRLRVPGGIGGAVRRSFAGEGAALTYVECDGPNERIELGSTQPGHVDAWDLARGPIIATRGSFLAAWGPAVTIDVTIARRVGAALFGGAGLFLQRISGQGIALIHGSGDFIRHELAPGERLIVSSGNLAAFSSTVDYRIRGVGGCMKMLFGREGIFMTELVGPGSVLLQTLKRGRGIASGAAGAAAAAG
ncbi:MAG TPA: AIM24 family protein [Phycisphaerales bacterium]|nr:AIM24 family protein [Phycisphaerales bacterium]HMP37228.1 AIM24 family protein [Phycisphaerales bacterium]